MLDFFKNLSSKPPGRDEFAALVMRALANGRVRIGRYDEKTFSLVREDGLKLQLQNGYARFCAADKSNRHAILVDIVSGIAALGTDPPDTEDFSAVRPRLLPLVRSAAYSSLTYLDLRASGKADPAAGSQRTNWQKTWWPASPLTPRVPSRLSINRCLIVGKWAFQRL